VGAKLAEYRAGVLFAHRALVESTRKHALAMNNENGSWRNVALARGHNWIFVPSSVPAPSFWAADSWSGKKHTVHCKIIKRVRERETSLLSHSLATLPHKKYSVRGRAFFYWFSHNTKSCSLSKLNNHQSRSIVERALCCCGHLINGGGSFVLTEKVGRLILSLSLMVLFASSFLKPKDSISALCG
jgi:hypothetical protein